MVVSPWHASLALPGWTPMWAYLSLGIDASLHSVLTTIVTTPLQISQGLGDDLSTSSEDAR
eukprot:scaffold71349_cov15-Prasinocladus_malaysianus.AAC.2